MTSLVAPLAGAVVLLLFGSLMAGFEAALVSLSEARLRALRDELGDRGRLLQRHLDDPNRALSRLLAGRVLCPLAGTALAASIARAHASWWEIPAIVLVMAFTYGILAELAVTYGRRRARTVALAALYWVRPFEFLFAPLAIVLAAAGRLAAGRHGESLPHEAPPVTEKEVEYLVEEAEHSGVVNPVSGQMLQGVFTLKDRTAREVMVPRTHIVALEVNTTLQDALKKLGEEGHSRIPVYRGQIDNVVGVLFAKDLYRVMTAGPPPDEPARDSAPRACAPPATLDEIIRKPAFFVSDHQSVLSVLHDMQSRRLHMALVVDEFGAVSGLVSLEDVLEEIVGEIQDEHDSDETPFVELPNGRYQVSAAYSITDLGEKLGVQFPDDGYASLGGFLNAQAGKVPEVGSVVVWHGLKFIVREGDKRRAAKVEIVVEAPRVSARPPAVLTH